LNPGIPLNLRVRSASFQRASRNADAIVPDTLRGTVHEPTFLENGGSPGKGNMNRTLGRFVASAAGALLAILPMAAQGSDFENEVAIVNYDLASGVKYGDLPSRAVLARIVEQISLRKPRSIAIKFFFDSKGNEADTRLLETALGSSERILLQASINPEPPTSKALDDRFFFKGSIGSIRPTVKGAEGWLPVKSVSDRAAKVCFVDVASPELVPMVTEFQGRPVESLYACVLGDVFGGGTMVFKDGRVLFRNRALPIDGAGQVKIPLSNTRLPKAISALDLLDGNADRKLLEGKVVLLIYTGPKSPTLPIGGSAVKVHQIFVAQLRDLFDAMGFAN
jgi:hypothetical protein